MFAILMVGAALLSACILTGWRRLEAQSWQNTNGVVESVTLDIWEEPQANYRFNVGGIDYLGSKLILGPLGAAPEPPVEGTKVLIYFDPNNPERCSLSISLDRGALLITSGLALVILMIPGLALFFLRKHVPIPPPEAALAPSSGRVPYQPKTAPGIPLGGVGNTRLTIEEWQPGKHIRIIQKRTWNLFPLSVAIIFVTGVFLWMTNQGGMTWEKMQLPLLMWSLLVLLPGLALSWPSQPGRATFDWAHDSIRIKSGRSLRVVGLRRLRAIELRYTSNRSITKAGSYSSRTSSWYQFVVWIEADTGETVPFLFASTRPRSFISLSDPDIESLKQLAKALAAHLDVPSGPLNKSTLLFE